MVTSVDVYTAIPALTYAARHCANCVPARGLLKYEVSRMVVVVKHLPNVR
jgi:hypothetical protein